MQLAVERELIPAALTALGVPSGQHVTVNLQRVTFARPAGLIALCTSIEYARRSGCEVSVLAPLNPDVARYMARAHLPEALIRLGATHNFSPVRESELGFRLVEIQTFATSEHVDFLAQGIHSFAEPADGSAADDLHAAVCEAGQNVEAHSESPRGYLMAQYFPNQRIFEFAIGDSGVGYLRRLRAAGAADHSEALHLAVVAGVSSTGESGRGLGLASIRSSLSAVGGSLTLVSGDSMRTYSARAGEFGLTRMLRGQHEGALVSGTLPSATPA